MTLESRLALALGWARLRRVDWTDGGVVAFRPPVYVVPSGRLIHLYVTAPALRLRAEGWL